MQTVTVYTDGACDPNPGPGGWAAILLAPSAGNTHRKVLTGSDPDTTNNRMELTAVISALTALKRRCQVRLHTDSSYVQKGVTEHLAGWKARGWRTSDKRSVANRDLWESLDAALGQHEIEWIWVKGHAGDPLNEECDRLAVAAIPRPAAAVVSGEVTTICTGASCLGSGPGGWAAVLRSGDDVWEVSGREERCSANALHLIAIERGLSLVAAGAQAQVVTPSDYAAQGGERWARSWAAAGWRTRDGGEVKNRELWEAILEQSRELKVTWHSLKTFGRTEDGQRADHLAREAARGVGRGGFGIGAAAS